MASYANQKKIIIASKESPQKGEKELYFSIKNRICAEAFRNLNKASVALYFYFYSNKEGWEFWLSPKDFCAEYGISQSQYYVALRELVEKGYLTQVNGNTYRFTAIPAASPARISIKGKEEKRTFVDDDTGETLILTYKQLLELLEGDKETADETWKDGGDCPAA